MKTNRYALSEIPSIRNIFAGDLKKYFKTEAADEVAFIEKAAQHIRLNLFADYPYCRFGEQDELLRKLLERGYSPQQISEALAEAWFHDRDVFYLPKKYLWLERVLNPNGFSITLAIILSWVTVFVIFLYGRKQFPDMVAVFLGFQPLLAIFAILIGYVYFRVIRIMFKMFGR